MVVLFTPGEQHESTVFIPLMERGAVKRPGRGAPSGVPSGWWGTRAIAQHPVGTATPTSAA